MKRNRCWPRPGTRQSPITSSAFASRNTTTSSPAASHFWDSLPMFAALPVGILLFLGATIGSGIWLYQKKTNADRKYREAQDVAHKALTCSIDLYRATAAEFVDAKIAYGKADDQELALLGVVDSWPRYTRGQERAS